MKMVDARKQDSKDKSLVAADDLLWGSFNRASKSKIKRLLKP